MRHRDTDAIGEALDTVESTLDVHTRAVAHLRAVYDATQPAPPDDDVIHVHAGEDLRSILEHAPDAATVECEPATYHGPFILTRPVTLRSSVEIDGRAGLEMPVWLTSGAEDTVSVRGPDVRLVRGLGITNSNPDYQLLAITREATRTLVDQVSCLGDPVYGQRRGIRPEGSVVVIRRCYVDHVGRPGLETQAVCGVVGGREILIDDSDLRGAAEAVMFGGGDTPSSDLTPATIRITRSTLTKRVDWYGMGWQIKNPFELKNARGVYVADTVMQYAGMAEGQSAFLGVFTPRNQDGGSPWACVEDVVIERCRCEYGGACASFMGSDYVHPSSGMLRNITLRDVLFDHVDPWGITGGSGNCFQIQRAPEHVTLDRVTVRGEHLNACFYFGPDMAPPWLTVRDVVVPAAFTDPHENDPYLWKIDGGGQGEAAARAFCTFPDDASKNIVIERVGTPDAAGASGYPE